MSLTKLVCLGDSLTFGYNMNEADKWTTLIRDKLHIPIVNAGISGDTTTGMLARFTVDVLSHKPSHLFIMGGTNDLYFDIADNIIISHIKAIIRQAQHYGIVTIIGIPTPIYPIHPPDSGLFISEEALLDRLHAYQEKLKAFAKEDELLIMDFRKNMPKNLFLNDGVHPNAEGQKVMAYIASKVLLTI